VQPPHWIALDGAANARAVVPGVLLRADNLQGLSDRDVRVLVDEHDLEVVLDLRTDVEVMREGPGPLHRVPAVRIEHRSLFPDAGERTDLETETVRPWDHSEDDEPFPDESAAVRAYLSYLRRRPDSIVGSVRAIAQARGSVLVHCAAGKDRTGVVIALALDAVGTDRALIAADYLATAERIRAILDRLIASDTYRAELEGSDPQRHAPVPGTIERVLEIVDARAGGAASWLSERGLPDEDLRRLEARLSPAPEKTAAR
jgi:protein tyrosine/serine phosphatase